MRKVFLVLIAGLLLLPYLTFADVKEDRIKAIKSQIAALQAELDTLQPSVEIALDKLKKRRSTNHDITFELRLTVANKGEIYIPVEDGFRFISVGKKPANTYTSIKCLKPSKSVTIEDEEYCHLMAGETAPLTFKVTLAGIEGKESIEVTGVKYRASSSAKSQTVNLTGIQTPAI